jgi:hypothetical protein
LEMIWAMILWLWRNHNLRHGVYGVDRAVDRMDVMDPSKLSIHGLPAIQYKRRRAAAKIKLIPEQEMQLPNEIPLLDTHGFL